MQLRGSKHKVSQLLLPCWCASHWHNSCTDCRQHGWWSYERVLGASCTFLGKYLGDVSTEGRSKHTQLWMHSINVQITEERGRWKHHMGKTELRLLENVLKRSVYEAKGLKACNTQQSCQGAATGLPWVKTVTKDLTETQQHICDMGSACINVTTCYCSTEQHRSCL